MRLYDSIDEITDYLKKDIAKSLVDIKENYIDDEMQEAIDESVYAITFDALNAYERREDGTGGLKNKANFKHTIDELPRFGIDAGNVSINIRNIAKGNEKYRGSTSDYIDKIIVTGKGYTWDNSVYAISEDIGSPIKRNFYKATKERIKGNIGSKLKKELEKRGWE